jgi:hypothetical protein
MDESFREAEIRALTWPFVYDLIGTIHNGWYRKYTNSQEVLCSSHPINWRQKHSSPIWCLSGTVSELTSPFSLSPYKEAPMLLLQNLNVSKGITPISQVFNT